MGKRNMIYAILDKKSNNIYFSEQERTEEELESTELLYTSDLVSLEDIKRNLRPWICLESIEREYYKNVPELKKYLETGNTYYSYNTIYSQDIDREINCFIDDLNFLNNLGCCNVTDNNNLEEIKDNIKYDCDVYNYLEDRFGKDLVNIVFLYRSLNSDCKRFLYEFNEIGTKDKKSEYIKKSIILKNNPEVIEFLPLWYRLDYKISDGYKKSDESTKLEYKRDKLLGESEQNIEEMIRDKFFDTFKLGSVIPGYEIKKIIQEIYDSIGLKKAAKISDLYNYFEVTNVSSSSSYRIDFRK